MKPLWANNGKVFLVGPVADDVGQPWIHKHYGRHLGAQHVVLTSEQWFRLEKLLRTANIRKKPYVKWVMTIPAPDAADRASSGTRPDGESDDREQELVSLRDEAVRQLHGVVLRPRWAPPGEPPHLREPSEQACAAAAQSLPSNSPSSSHRGLITERGMAPSDRSPSLWASADGPPPPRTVFDEHGRPLAYLPSECRTWSEFSL